MPKGFSVQNMSVEEAVQQFDQHQRTRATSLASTQSHVKRSASNNAFPPTQMDNISEAGSSLSDTSTIAAAASVATVNVTPDNKQSSGSMPGIRVAPPSKTQPELERYGRADDPWVVSTDEDGTAYYYNARTKYSTWSSPTAIFSKHGMEQETVGHDDDDDNDGDGDGDCDNDNYEYRDDDDDDDDVDYGASPLRTHRRQVTQTREEQTLEHELDNLHISSEQDQAAAAAQAKLAHMQRSQSNPGSGSNAYRMDLVSNMRPERAMDADDENVDRYSEPDRTDQPVAVVAARHRRQWSNAPSQVILNRGKSSSSSGSSSEQRSPVETHDMTTAISQRSSSESHQHQHQHQHPAQPQRPSQIQAHADSQSRPDGIGSTGDSSEASPDLHHVMELIRRSRALQDSISPRIETASPPQPSAMSDTAGSSGTASLIGSTQNVTAPLSNSHSRDSSASTPCHRRKHSRAQSSSSCYDSDAVNDDGDLFDFPDEDGDDHDHDVSPAEYSQHHLDAVHENVNRDAAPHLFADEELDVGGASSPSNATYTHRRSSSLSDIRPGGIDFDALDLPTIDADTDENIRALAARFGEASSRRSSSNARRNSSISAGGSCTPPLLKPVLAFVEDDEREPETPYSPSVAHTDLDDNVAEAATVVVSESAAPVVTLPPPPNMPLPPTPPDTLQGKDVSNVLSRAELPRRHSEQPALARSQEPVHSNAAAAPAHVQVGQSPNYAAHMHQHHSQLHLQTSHQMPVLAADRVQSEPFVQATGQHPVTVAGPAPQFIRPASDMTPIPSHVYFDPHRGVFVAQHPAGHISGQPFVHPMYYPVAPPGVPSHHHHQQRPQQLQQVQPQLPSQAQPHTPISSPQQHGTASQDSSPSSARDAHSASLPESPDTPIGPAMAASRAVHRMHPQRHSEIYPGSSFLPPWMRAASAISPQQLPSAGNNITRARPSSVTEAEPVTIRVPRGQAMHTGYIPPHQQQQQMSPSSASVDAHHPAMSTIPVQWVPAGAASAAGANLTPITGIPPGVLEASPRMEMYWTPQGSFVKMPSSARQASSADPDRAKRRSSRRKSHRRRPAVDPDEKIEYQKGDLLDKGGFGKVYRALNLKTAESFAIKEIEMVLGDETEMDRDRREDQLRTLKREVGLMRQLRHRHILSYLGIEYTPRAVRIFLELAQCSLVSMIRRFGGSLHENLVRNFTQQILCGLSYLHRRNVIHRDIKGANILLGMDDFLKLADFGASKYVNDIFKSNPHSLVGTPYWMAPEIVLEENYHSKADIWSVGCVIVEMLTGQHPYAEFNQFAAIYRISAGEPPPYPKNKLSDLGNEFLSLCFRRDPAERPSAAELLQHAWITAIPSALSRGAAASDPVTPSAKASGSDSLTSANNAVPEVQFTEEYSGDDEYDDDYYGVQQEMQNPDEVASLSELMTSVSASSYGDSKTPRRALSIADTECGSDIVEDLESLEQDENNGLEDED
jgi:serine/threonine protein kinase